jgi:hypothetical protein
MRSGIPEPECDYSQPSPFDVPESLDGSLCHSMKPLSDSIQIKCITILPETIHRAHAPALRASFSHRSTNFVGFKKKPTSKSGPLFNQNNESNFEHRKRQRKNTAAGGGYSSPASPNGEFGLGSKVFHIFYHVPGDLQGPIWKSSALTRPLFHR